MSLKGETRWAPRAGAEGVASRQRERLAGAVAFAREHSPYYREHYRGLPERVEDPTMLPVTGKSELMARFDDWVTDRRVTHAGARAFLDDRGTVAKPLLGDYLIATSTGTTGTRGIVLKDRPEMAVADAVRSRALRRWLDLRDVARILAGRARTAALVATGGHFVGLTLMSQGRWRRRTIRIFPVYALLSDLVAELNAYRPAILNGYSSTIMLLAAEQEAGRLRIDPTLVLPSAEALAPGDAERLERAFGAKLGISYTSAECPFIAHSCALGNLHVNSDWVVLEPVDADHRPTPQGEPSHTVLLSNLANRVQPVLRYSLDDRVMQLPEPCPCGNPMPAIRVMGRTAEVLKFPAGGAEARVTALELGGLIDTILDIKKFQVVQTTPTTLRVRLLVSEQADSDRVWQRLHDSIKELLAEQALGHVSVERGEEGPQQSEGGKYKKVIPLAEP